MDVEYNALIQYICVSSSRSPPPSPSLTMNRCHEIWLSPPIRRGHEELLYAPPGSTGRVWDFPYEQWLFSRNEPEHAFRCWTLSTLCGMGRKTKAALIVRFVMLAFYHCPLTHLSVLWGCPHRRDGHPGAIICLFDDNGDEIMRLIWHSRSYNCLATFLPDVRVDNVPHKSRVIE